MVRIFKARFADLPDQFQVLNDAEQARAARFVRPSDGLRFRAGRAWLRQRLAAELAVAACEIELVDGPQGKPELKGTPFHFNLTHTKHDIWLAVADAPVGIDLELPPKSDLTGLYKQIAAPDEWGQVQSEEITAERFLFLWTAKEAVLKLLGTGLMTDPRTISLGPLDPTDSKVIEIGGQRICLQHLPALQGAVGHVAMFGSTLEIRFQDELLGQGC